MINSNQSLARKADKWFALAEKALLIGSDALYTKAMEKVLMIDAEIKSRKEWGTYNQYNWG